MLETNKIYCGDALTELKKLPSNVIDMCITSPPYWALRDYGVKEQLGLEKTYQEYINNLCDIFDEVKRTLKKTGTCWVVIGDTYGGSGNSTGHTEETKNLGYKTNEMGASKGNQKSTKGLEKCLINIPARFSIEMINRGWILRNTIIWNKPNCMPCCLHPKTNVFVKRVMIKQIPIEDIEKGDLILTPHGWKRVLERWETRKKPFKLEIGKIDKIISSEDHRFAISHDKRREKLNFIEVKKIRSINSKGHYNDFFVYKNMREYFGKPTLNEIDITIDKKTKWYVDIKDIQEKFNINSPYNFAKEIGDKSLRKVRCKSTWVYASDTHNELKRGRIKIWKVPNYTFTKILASNSPIKENRFYKLDYKLGWLIGLYTAEGGFNQPRGFQGKITLHKKESNIAKKFKIIFKQKFGHKIQGEKIIDNYRSITFTSAGMYSLCKRLFIKGKCKTKEVVINRFLNTPTEFREGFVDGYFEGDGYTKNNKKTVTSASKQLIKNVQIILSTLGKVYSKNTDNNYFSLWSNSYQEFNKRNLVYCRLISKKEEVKRIKMIDIQVEGGEFLIENGLISHNSVKDRFTVDFEYVFFFVKSKKYYFEQQFEQYTDKTDVEYRKRLRQGKIYDVKEPYKDNVPYSVQPRTKDFVIYRNLPNLKEFSNYINETRKEEGLTIEQIENIFKTQSPHHWFNGESFPSKEDYLKLKEIINLDMLYDKGLTEEFTKSSEKTTYEQGRNKRCVWQINPKPFKEPHFAVFPEKLIKTPIQAGCPEKGIVLDPFMGAGTSALVSLKLNRQFIGFELNQEYVNIANKRIEVWQGQERLF